MAGFDQYVETKNENNGQLDQEGLDTLKEEQRQRGFGAEEQQLTSSVQDINDTYDRLNQTSLEDRTDYYFRNSELTGAKAERYENLGNNREALNAYAKEHTNRSADKRGKKARKAAKSCRLRQAKVCLSL